MRSLKSILFLFFVSCLPVYSELNDEETSDTDVIDYTSSSIGNFSKKLDDSESLVDKLLKITSSCDQVPFTAKFKKDANSVAEIPICKLNGAIWWRADADINCDGQATPECTKDPNYEPGTSGRTSDGKPMNSVEMPFISVPLPSNGFDPKKYGVITGWDSKGSIAIVIYNGKMIYAPYADASPSGILGDISYKAAEKLGIPLPTYIDFQWTSGGVDDGVTYIIFTGQNYVSKLENENEVIDLGESLVDDLIRGNL